MSKNHHIRIDDLDDFDFSVGLNDKKPDEAKEPVDCPFTILIDTSEKLPYTFQEIIANQDQDYAPVKVKTKPSNLYVADYAIEGNLETAVERKSKADLFQSLGQRRRQFEETIILMSESYRKSAVVMECSATEIYISPPEYSQMDPKTIYNTILSWGLKYPSVHWYFCDNRHFAEQTTYRLLHQFYEFSMNSANRFPTFIDSFVEAFKRGVIQRLTAAEAPNCYKVTTPLSRYFERGWNWASLHFYSNDKGNLIPFEKSPPTSGQITNDVPSIDMNEFPFDFGKANKKPSKVKAKPPKK